MFAFAALGGDVNSVESDRAAMQATTLRVTRAAGFEVHEIQASTGSIVRQYLSPSGKVFGIAWEGPVLPDFRQVLGTHFDKFITAQKNRRSRGPIIVREPGLVLYSGGHMRSFSGAAYVPQLLPSGVSGGDIQ